MEFREEGKMTMLVDRNEKEGKTIILPFPL